MVLVGQSRVVESRKKHSLKQQTTREQCIKIMFRWKTGGIRRKLVGLWKPEPHETWESPVDLYTQIFTYTHYNKSENENVKY
jgi:hypothetical protein